MNVKIILLPLLIIYAIISQTGCFNENNEDGLHLPEDTIITGDTDKLKIIGYTVTTTWTTYDEQGNETDHTHPGFYHEYPYELLDVIYKVKGKVQNIADETLEDVYLEILFCDVNNTCHAREHYRIYNVTAGDLENFTAYVMKFETLHFRFIDKINFEVTVVQD